MKLKAVREGGSSIINATRDTTYDITAFYSDENGKKFSILFTYMIIQDFLMMKKTQRVYHFIVRDSDKRFTMEQAQIMLEEALNFEENAPNEEIMNEKIHEIMEAVLRQVNIHYRGLQEFAVIIKDDKQMKEDIKKIILR